MDITEILKIRKLPDGTYSIFGCLDKRIKTITIPSEINGIRVTNIAKEAFRQLDGLLEVVLPSCLLSIGDNAFYECIHLERIVFPSSLKTIGNGAFVNCRSLESIDIPNSVIKIGKSAFSGCYKVKEIALPTSLRKIENDSFSWCFGLRSIIVPDNVETIEDGAFCYCKHLTTVVLGKGVSNLGRSFQHCPQLKAVVVNNDNLSLSKLCFTIPKEWLSRNSIWHGPHGWGVDCTRYWLPVWDLSFFSDNPSKSLREFCYEYGYLLLKTDFMNDEVAINELKKKREMFYYEIENSTIFRNHPTSKECSKRITNKGHYDNLMSR